MNLVMYVDIDMHIVYNMAVQTITVINVYFYKRHIYNIY